MNNSSAVIAREQTCSPGYSSLEMHFPINLPKIWFDCGRKRESTEAPPDFAENFPQNIPCDPNRIRCQPDSQNSIEGDDQRATAAAGDKPTHLNHLNGSMAECFSSKHPSRNSMRRLIELSCRFRK